MEVENYLDNVQRERCGSNLLEMKANDLKRNWAGWERIRVESKRNQIRFIPIDEANEFK
jgi:hypothetical protein